jgi:hypothetical protein
MVFEPIASSGVDQIWKTDINLTDKMTNPDYRDLIVGVCFKGN